MATVKTNVEELIKENKELRAEVSALRKHLKDLAPVVASINAKSLNGGNLFSDWLKSGQQVEFNCGSVPEYLFLSGWYSHKKSVSEKSLSIIEFGTKNPGFGYSTAKLVKELVNGS